MSGVSGSVSARSSEHARTRSGGSAPDCGGRGGGGRSLRGSLRDNLRVKLLTKFCETVTILKNIEWRHNAKC